MVTRSEAWEMLMGSTYLLRGAGSWQAVAAALQPAGMCWWTRWLHQRGCASPAEGERVRVVMTNPFPFF
jgi:hypothetical protein